MNPGFPGLPGPRKAGFMGFRTFAASGMYQPSPGVTSIVIWLQQAGSAAGSAGALYARRLSKAQFGDRVAVVVGANPSGHTTFGAFTSATAVDSAAMIVAPVGVASFFGGPGSNAANGFCVIEEYSTP